MSFYGHKGWWKWPPIAGVGRPPSLPFFQISNFHSNLDFRQNQKLKFQIPKWSGWPTTPSSLCPFTFSTLETCLVSHARKVRHGALKTCFVPHAWKVRHCWRSLLTNFDRQIRYKYERTSTSCTHMLFKLTYLHMYWKNNVLSDACMKYGGKYSQNEQREKA